MDARPSYSWRSIMEARSVLQAGLFWRIGNDRLVKISEDDWIPNVSSHSLEKPTDTMFELVSDLINMQDYTWDIPTVHACFDPNIASQVLSIPLSRRVGLIELHENWIKLWNALWRANVPNKVAIFCWRAAHNLLPTRTALTSKGYSGELNCCVCSESMETLEHVFQECSIAKDILGAPPFSFPSSSLFWKNRNDKFWRNRSQTSQSLVASPMVWYEEYLQANKPLHKSISARQNANKLWIAPTGETLKLNVDGAFLPNVQFGGTGGVLRNAQGQFLAAFLR
ncbi:uncharacterized protein LOC133737522 [Rosa rugosa]|uniref:uncharacterized protein LOC133737522 n=1 Tax=Rosa rugosa TaxID=74645 RepID=UPI002B404551|nr:uncharacterized protein LOC133737522 [Rosa rugosa]